MILLPLPHKCYIYRNALSCLAFHPLIKVTSFQERASQLNHLAQLGKEAKKKELPHSPVTRKMER
jgi:hypothetical protein